MILPIVKEPDPILHQKATPIKQITPEIRRLAADMIETMHVAEGVGLAANQVGSSWHLLVASPDGQKGKELVLLNGSILSEKGKGTLPEGCLSLPGVSAEGVDRFLEVTATGLDLEGKGQTLQATGLLAQILQHEVDHLEGRLYPERLSASDRQKLLQKYKSLADMLRRVDL